MLPDSSPVDESAKTQPRKRKRRKSTSHLKLVPETLSERERIKAAAEQFAESLDRAQPFDSAQLETWGRELLEELELPEKFLGFAAVLIGNFFWKRQFLAVPFERRMLLLPHCLKHAEGCPAEYDEFGLDCEKCGACSIADYKVRAEQLGYKVLVAEGSPVVLKIIVGGHVDGILGVACLNVLEKAIDKVLIAGVPSYAIPLHSGDCKNTSLDESWVWDVLEKYEPLPEPLTSSYLPLIRESNRLFEQDFERLLPPVRSQSSDQALTPLAKTEEIAYDWLARGGKRFRPFITLAAYDAMTGGESLKSTQRNGDGLGMPDSVCRVAMAIEAFHKASLVHDDIQDDDLFRYGRETLHRKHDPGTAINVGDYLIGIGYQLVNSARSEVSAEITCDVLDRMAAAHIKLCDGQGAEMAWHEQATESITLLDVLQIYALKTSPAFEAALYAGMRMAGDVSGYEEMIPSFSRQLGVGFQVLNDLKDWRGDANNKLVAGQDMLAGRPTVMLALAFQSADDEQRQRLLDVFSATDVEDEIRMERLKGLLVDCGVFDQAELLVEKARVRAESLADDVEVEPLRRLLYFLVDTVLADEDQAGIPVPTPEDVLLSLPVAQ
ncbi:MAG TPA: polyprenyl synthetase [Planctomycetaceae bacterium]|nr:polyprenyl synthetase [Planctomycetaceae bacterium]|tara:strand:+ start:2384 stop:4207 length:1824 start_codon:yes stop_codon:yes gene_type:complete